jgi:hypothetical protein
VLLERFVSELGELRCRQSVARICLALHPLTVAVVAAFDGGAMTSEAGALLLGATDQQIGMIERFAGCFSDQRVPDLVEHAVAGLGGSACLGLPRAAYAALTAAVMA